MLDIIIQYWYLFAIILLVVAFYLVKHFAKGQAKTLALKYLLDIENTVFSNADVGVSLAASAAYKALPMRIRVLVPEIVFTALFTELYNEIKKLISELDKNASSK